MNKYILLLLVISLFSCERKKPSKVNEVQTIVPVVKETKTKPSKEVKKEEKIEESIEESKELKTTKTNQVLSKSILFGELKVIVEEKNSKISITANDEFSEKYDLSLKGNVDAFIETDVDGNGFNEFYIVTNSGDLAAFCSYNNKSFGQIYVPKKPFTFYESFTKVKFWEAKNKKLSITFENKQGELNSVRYKLVKGESSFQLVAE